jgi:hypothetical protein
MTKPRTPPVPSPPAAPGLGRRSVLQGLLAGAGAGLAVPGLAESHPMAEHARHPERIQSAQARAGEAGPAELLDAYQMRMLDSLGERIVPGSGAAGCARFIDSLLAVGGPEPARRLVTALGAIDAEARTRFEKPWTELDAAQQAALLEAASSGDPGRPATGPWTPGAPVAEYLAQSSPRPGETRRVTLRDRFDEVKGWVVGAYYSSEPGQWDLGYTGLSFGATFEGCAHPGGHRKA